VGTVRILYRADTISFQAAVHPKYTLGALNMKEEKNHFSAVAGTLFNLTAHCGTLCFLS